MNCNQIDIDECDFIAHIRKDGERLLAHSLPSHNEAVSRLAGEFAASFKSSRWAALAGLWHDLGKFREGFQRYIRLCGDPDAHIEGRVAGTDKTHSAAGALWAQRYLEEVDKRSGPVVARVLSYLIAGHHAGLSDWAGENKSLHNRFASEDAQRELATACAAPIPEYLLKPAGPLPDMADLFRYRDNDKDDPIPGRFALWVRMLFSCLVDADFLDTEAFMSPGKSEVRQGFPGLDVLEQLLSERLDKMAREVAERGEADSKVNRKRAEVLRACLAKAELPPGVFSLTVPTGGGKTLSSLAFALRHAVRHGQRRVVYAIPYTSIIEQTAGIFRGILGDENVIEHHSNVEVDETQEIARHEAVLAIVGRRADARDLYRQLKTENPEGLWHLSGLMCAEHRSNTIQAIKAALSVRRQASQHGQGTQFRRAGEGRNAALRHLCEGKGRSQPNP